MLNSFFRPKHACFFVGIILISYLFGYLSGQTHPQILDFFPQESSAAAVGKQLLDIHVDYTTQTRIIHAEQLGGSFDRDIEYRMVENVTIAIQGTPIPLENAIRDGYITPVELFCYARLDASNGFCEETYQSSKGLSAFIYSYPTIDLWMVYDVWETPDGQQHKICDFSVCRAGAGRKIHPGGYLDTETKKRLDREDWGLELEVEMASSNQLLLSCIQSKGQHIGQLHIYSSLSLIKQKHSQSKGRRLYPITQQSYKITA